MPGSGASVHIPFSSDLRRDLEVEPGDAGYLRYYSGTPDMLVDGTQTAATNVVVMTVPTSNGPWVENSEGGLEVQVNAIGSGPVVVLRDGVAITGTWTRIEPHPAGHAHRRRRGADHAPARQHLGGAGTPGDPGDDHGGRCATTRRPGQAARPDVDSTSTTRGPDRRSGAPVSRRGERPAQQVERGDGGVLADPVPVAGDGERERLGVASRTGQPDEHRPGGLAVLPDRDRPPR